MGIGCSLTSAGQCPLLAFKVRQERNEVNVISSYSQLRTICGTLIYLNLSLFAHLHMALTFFSSISFCLLLCMYLSSSSRSSCQGIATPQNYKHLLVNQKLQDSSCLALFACCLSSSWVLSLQNDRLSVMSYAQGL